MKKILFTAIYLFGATAIAAADELPDTVLNVANPSKVVIYENPTGVRVDVTGPKTARDVYTFEADFDTTADVTSTMETTRSLRTIMGSGHRPGWDVYACNNVGLGWISSQGVPAGVNLEMGKSLEVSWLDMLAVYYRNSYGNRLIMGLGMDWRNYKIADGSAMFMANEGGQVSVGNYPGDVTPVNSRLKVVTLGLSLRWQQQFNRSRMPWGGKLSLEWGAIANYTTHASVKSRWFNENGNRVEQVNCNINCRRFTVDFIGIVHLGYALGFYVRYSPMKVLTGAIAPDIQPLSTGIMLAY